MNQELSKVERRVISYLKYRGEVTPNQMELIRDGLNEAVQLINPAFKHRFFKLEIRDGIYHTENDIIDVTFDSLQRMFQKEQSDSLCVLVATIGPAIDRKTELYAKRDSSKMIILDACANALIEEETDKYQRKLNLKNPSFRYAPGYGDVPLDLQKQIFDAMPEIEKIGIRLDSGNLMHPFKSMTGLIGFQSNK